MKHIVYKTTNLISGKIYIGVHSSIQSQDTYLGSGIALNKAIKKYGKDKFKRETLFTFDNIDDAYMKESELVNSEFVAREDTYNLAIGGQGGTRKFKDIRKTNKRISTSQKIRMNSVGFKPWNLGRKCPEIGNKPAETRKLRGISYAGKNNPMYGVDLRDKLNDDEIKLWGNRISKALTGKVRSDEAKANYSKAAKSRKWLIHRDGQLCSTTDPNDFRFTHPDWQLGRKWKVKCDIQLVH